MDKAQYEALSTKDETAVIGISPRDLADQSDRMLIDGYDTDRVTYQLHLENGEFVCYFYTHADRNYKPVAWRTLAGEAVPVSWLYPNKRVYPETSDFEFIRMIRRHEGHESSPSVTTWDQARYDLHHA